MKYYAKNSVIIFYLTSGLIATVLSCYSIFYSSNHYDHNKGWIVFGLVWLGLALKKVLNPIVEINDFILTIRNDNSDLQTFNLRQIEIIDFLNEKDYPREIILDGKFIQIPGLSLETFEKLKLDVIELKDKLAK